MNLFRTKPVTRTACGRRRPRRPRRAHAEARADRAAPHHCSASARVIGAGIFVLTGNAAANHAGPAIVLSFVIAGIACVFAGLCYAEFAVDAAGLRQRLLLRLRDARRSRRLVHRLDAGARIHVRRRDRRGRLVRLLRRACSNRSAAGSASRCRCRQRSRMRRSRSSTAGLVLTGAIDQPAGRRDRDRGRRALLPRHHAVGDRQRGHRGDQGRRDPAVHGLQRCSTSIPTTGLRSSRSPKARAASASTACVRGASVVFFAYIGFDAVSTAAQEAKNPQRDMPIGILGSLVDLHADLHRDVGRDDRHHAVQPARHAAAGRDRARDVSEPAVAQVAGGDRRDRGTHLGDPRDDPRPAAHLLFDVAGRPDPAAVRPRPPGVPHAARRHRHRRRHRRDPRGPAADRRAGRPGVDGHAARVRDGLHRRAGAAPHAARTCRARSACPRRPSSASSARRPACTCSSRRSWPTGTGCRLDR